MIEFALFILFLSTILYSFLPTTIFIVGGSAVWTSDLIIMIIILFTILKYFGYLSSFNYTQPRLRKYVFYIFVLLTIPIFIGILNGHNIFSTLRDARSLFLCIIPFIILLELTTLEKWYRFIRLLGIVLVLVQILFIISFIFNISFNYLGENFRYNTVNGTILQYGLPGAFAYYPIILYFSLVCLIRKIQPPFIKSPKLLPVLLLFSIIAVYLSGSRGYFISVMFGILIIIITFRKLLTKKIFFSSIVGILLFVQLSSSINELLISSPIVNRYLTTLRGEEEENIYLRTNAMTQAHDLSENLIFGSGYGGKNQSGNENISKIKNLTHILALNSYAWGIYRLGYLGLILFLIFYLLFILGVKKSLLRTQDDILSPIVLTLIIYLVITLLYSAGNNVFFRGNSATITLSIILGLLIALENIFLNEDLSLININSDSKN